MPGPPLPPSPSRLKVAFFGTPQFSVPILNSISHHHQVILVVSQPNKPVGPGLQSRPSPVSHFAQQHHLPLFTPTSLKTASVRRHISNLQADIAVVAAYGHILPQWLLDWPTYGCLNIHTSLLPRYRGAAPITAALLHGDNSTGITYIKMDSKMDEGPIIDQTIIDIDQSETADSLFIKMSQTASEYINPVLDKYINNPQHITPQNHTQATYTKQISKQDGFLDLNDLPANWRQRIYAYHSWPGAWTIFQGKRVKLLPNSLVQMEGKKAAPLADFLNGYPNFPLQQPW